jgi:hypothetical protein
MNSRRNYTIGERAILVLGIRANKPYHEISRLLKKYQDKNYLGQKILNLSSYQMVKDKYLPKMNDEQVWEYIESPKSLGNL